MKILLAEDQKELSNALVTILKIKGYEVDAVYDGGKAIEQCASVEYDGIILDIMMPVKDGLEVLTYLRENRIHTPVLMLTAKAQIEDRVKGLELGADDYLSKPFVMDELLARVHAMLRRQTEYVSQKYELGNTVLEYDGMELSVGSNSLRLAGKETQLMALFMSAPGRLISSTQVKEKVWPDEEITEQKITLYISYIEGKLASIHSNIRVKEEEGGYRLEVEND